MKNIGGELILGKKKSIDLNAMMYFASKQKQDITV